MQADLERDDRLRRVESDPQCVEESPSEADNQDGNPEEHEHSVICANERLAIAKVEIIQMNVRFFCARRAGLRVGL